MTSLGTRSTVWLLKNLQQRLAPLAELRLLLGAGSHALPASLASGSTGRSLQTCSGTSNHVEAFEKRFSLPINSSISIRLHKPGNVEVAKGAMEEVTFEVCPFKSPYGVAKFLMGSVS